MITIRIYEYNELPFNIQSKILENEELCQMAENDYWEREFEDAYAVDSIVGNAIDTIDTENNLLDYEIYYYTIGYSDYYSIEKTIWKDGTSEEYKIRTLSKIKEKIEKHITAMYEFMYSDDCIIEYIEFRELMFTEFGEIITLY